MTSPALERKIRQLDNDVQSIYEMLSSISGTQLRHGNRFDEIDQRLESMDGRLGNVEGRLGNVEGRLESVEGRLESVDGKIDTVLEILRGQPSR